MSASQPNVFDVAGFYDAWNRRDADRIARAFGDEGRFRDPLARRAVSGDALRDHVTAQLAALPEVAFRVEHAMRDGERIAVSWTLRAVCNGALDAEIKADGVAFALEGTDVFHVSGARIVDLRRWFERRDLADRLGLQSITLPIAVGSMAFGYSLRDWVSKEKPGVLGMTWILARDEAEKATIRARARDIIRHFHEVPGFIGIVTGFAGLHGFTFTAWESEDALRRGTHAGPHLDAMKAFRDGLSAAVFTSVWTPTRLNRMWSRCANGHANDATRVERTCEQCGAPLPEPEPYV